MSTAAAPDLAEQQHALDPVPEAQRESTAMHQFWIWAGANIAPINWVLGALGIVLGLSLADTVLVLVVGNLIGMAVFGFFVLMGQRTGVSQMVLTRSAFGRRGAYLPAIIQGITSAGWCAINTWIVLDLVVALLGQLGIEGGIGMKIAIVAVVMALQTWIAANGFRWIAAFEKYTVPVTLAVLLVMTVVAWTKLDVDWGYDGAGLTGTARLSAMSTVMTAIGIGWGITWLAYASDYSRFVPRSVPGRKLYAASVLGQFIPVVWLGVLGASVATIGQQADPGKLIVAVFGALAIPVLLLVLHGPIATNILNIYSCALCALTVDLKISRRTMAYLVGVFAFAFTDRADLPGELRARPRRLAGQPGRLGRPVGVDHGGALLLPPPSAHRHRGAVRPAGTLPAGRRAVGRDGVVPPRHRRHLVLRVRHPHGAPGPRREDAGQRGPVLAGRPRRRRRPVRGARLPTPG